MSDEPENAGEPLSPNEANLAHLANRHGPDLFLLDMIERAELSGAYLSVGLLVNGMVILGRLTSPVDMAKAIDAETAKAATHAERPEGISEEEWAEAKKRVATRETDNVEAQTQALRDLDDECKALGEPGGIDPFAVPGELARRLIAANNRSHLTLAEVTIGAPGQPGRIALDVLRISLDQVAAWWPLQADEAGRVQTILWRIDGKRAHDPPPPEPAAAAEPRGAE
jgi:hypothetical protein